VRRAPGSEAADGSTAPVRAAQAAERNAEELASAWVARARARRRTHPRLAETVALGSRIVARQSSYRLSLAAAGVAFWLVIALFPAIVAVILAFGLVLDPEDLAADVGAIGRRAPDSLASVLGQQAETVAGTYSGTISIGLVVSLVVVLWGVSSGAYALFRATRQAYGLPPQNWVVARARAFAAAAVAVAGLGILIGGSTVVGTWIAGMSGVGRAAAVLAVGLGVMLALIPLLVVVMRLSIAQPTPVRDLLPGAVVAAVVIAAMLVGVSAFGFIVREYQAMYGVVASIVLAMVVAYSAMYVLLLSVLLNSELARRRALRSGGATQSG
jgi:membrane protein